MGETPVMKRVAAAARPILVPLLLVLAGVDAGAAQNYPARPIRLVIPYPPGGPTDFVGRTVGQKLTEYMGQQVVVDNRPGAATVIASELVARANPDGYTLLFGTGGGTFLAPLIVPNVPYDPRRDFAPIAMLVMSPQVLVVHPSVAANSVAELIALAKAKPGVLNFASVGTGTSPHLGGELFKAMAGVDVVHVPYKGTAPAMTDLLAGRVQFMFTSMPTVLAHAKAGKLKLLASGGTRRSRAIAETPLVGDTLPGFELVTWYGIFGPARTPADVVSRLNAEIGKALSDSSVQQRLGAQGLETSPMTPQELRKYTERDVDRWTRLVERAGIKAAK
jgi:tripartite-type tricarboxylate transporter receptor subunit TctC